LIGQNGLLKQLAKLLVERPSYPDGNSCNGKSKKMRKGEFGELPIEIPQGTARQL
jgi:putative transposase